jgi:hypothetical protein
MNMLSNHHLAPYIQFMTMPLCKSMTAVEIGSGGGIVGIQMAVVQTGSAAGKGSPTLEVAV